jgi:hypothetical protein
MVQLSDEKLCVARIALVGVVDFHFHSLWERLRWMSL